MFRALFPAARQLPATILRATARPSVRVAAAATGGVALAAICPLARCDAQSVDLTAVREQIEAIIDDEMAYNPSVDQAPGPLAGGGDLAPMFLRLAWHCAGTWDQKEQNGGSNGATMRFSPEADHGGNAGLEHARNLLEPVKATHPAISYADLYIFAGKVAVESMGGPEIGFNLGRTDVDGPAKPTKGSVHSPDGRLPDAAQGAQHLRDIFYRMGFNDQEIVALSGAHSTGRCHTDRSGFWGPWSYSPSTFSNEYFRLLLEEEWTPKQTHEGNPWDYDAHPQLESRDKKLMMLLTDMALIEDPKFRRWVELYKADEELFFQHFGEAFQKLTELGTNVGQPEGYCFVKRFSWQ